MQINWKAWAAVVLSAGLLELPFPIAGPMPPWRSVFAWFGLAPLIWAVLSHPCREDNDAARMGQPSSQRNRKDKAAKLQTKDEDVSAGTPGMGHPTGSLRRAFLLTYVCGVLWYMGNCYWIYDTMHIHGELPPAVSFLILLLFSLVLGGYFGLFGLGLALVRGATGSVRWALAFAPFLWVGLELAGARTTSVPWDQLGYSQVDNGLVSQLAPWTGVYGISFCIVLVNAALAGALLLARGPWSEELAFKASSFFQLQKADSVSCAFAGISLLLAGFAGLSDEPPKVSTSATAVLIQPDLDVENTGYWMGPGEYEQHIADFIKLGGEDCKNYVAGLPQTSAPTAEMNCTSAPTHPDLILWPESPAPFFEQEPRFERAMAEVARADHAPLIVNGVGSNFLADENAWQDHVSAMVFDANGNEVGRYDKIHLVPWGEYVPYPKIFFFAKKLTGKVAHFTPGTVRNVFRLQTANGETHRYGVFICYEAVFADEIRQFAKNGAEVFVTGSDDGWYGDTSAPWQHLNMARMRAIENRRWILRGTNDGVTAAIDPYGRVRQSIPRHVVDALPAQYGFRDDITFYTEHGDVFAWVCTVVAIAGVVWAMSKRVSKSASRQVS
jgi:apolipoprotein N-acyltransferase